MKALIALFLFALSLTATAAPTAWGQPMPEHCTTTFERKSPNSYPVHVYKDPTCAKPWAANAATFWRGLFNRIQDWQNSQMQPQPVSIPR